MTPPTPPAPDRRPAVRSTVRVVREQLTGNPLWRFYARNGKWLCPYCLALVAKRAGKGMPDSILLHLEACKSWARGKGAAQAEALILKRLRHEDLVTLIDGDPGWRITDQTGTWFCPACQERVPQVRMPAGMPLSSFTYQAVAEHLGRCPLWQQDALPTPAQIACARSRAACMPQLIAFAQERLAIQLWRYTDPGGQWICPYCLGHIPLARPTGTNDWARSSEGIAQHLLCRCPSYAANPSVTRPEEQVRAAAQAPGSIAGQTPSAGLPAMRTPRSPTEASPSPALPIAQPMTRRLSTLTSRTPTTSTNTIPPALGREALTPATPVGVVPVPAPAPVEEDTEVMPLNWMDDAEESGATSTGPVNDNTDMIRARDVQQNLMQRPPDLPGLRFGVLFEPCNDISGDFYEFIRLHDGRFGFALGDVSGHGVQAGLIMSMAKKTLEIYAGTGSSPADTLAKVNDSLHRDLAGKMFVSMVYAILDPERRTITWARAGHNPPLRLTAAGVVSEIKPSGMVVGMKDGAIYRRAMTEEVTPLESGDTFLLFTDGVVEAMNLQQEEFGDERLQEVLRRYAADGPQVLVDHIVDLVRHFRGPQSRADDVTVLALAVD